jgi:hypothetical protein
VDAGSYTTSTALLEALAEAGVRYIFANLGSDHPGLIEAFASATADGREDEFPRLVVCPHETVALSAAHAYATVTRQPQAVFVHVDAGTQNLGGAVSNALRGRVPVLIFAGAAPFTDHGELTSVISAASCAATSSTTTRSALAAMSSRSCTARSSSPAASRPALSTWSARAR